MDNFNNSVFISLNGENTMVLILGGGNGAFIKATTLLKRGFIVHCLSEEYTTKFKELSFNYSNLLLLNEIFTENMLANYHLVVICTSDNVFNDKVRSICNNQKKIFIDSTVPEVSKAILCASRITKNIALGIRINGKNPKSSVFLCNKGRKYYEKFDDYVEFTTMVRLNITKIDKKNEILDYINSDDFLFFFNQGVAKEILELFYPDILNEICDWNNL
ncbi:NAD(P)-dependent oxidoreductase [Clostridium sp.]|uniref:NAD(P)-dependent oxidoreductase n=1 Tax=Clostridium sp. TaxID=1506 RepID=UPI003217C1DD